MSSIAYDRLVSGGAVLYDRLVDTTGNPVISSIGTVQDGATITITGTGFSASGNTVFFVQGTETQQIAVGSEGTTSITTAALDTSGIYLSQPITLYVTNNSGIASNSLTVSILPAAGATVSQITQSFLGDPTTRLSSNPDLALGDEVRISNIVGGSTSDVTIDGQGSVKAATAVSAFDFQVFDGFSLGSVGTETLSSPVTTVSVPSLLGFTEDDALAALTALGLVLSVQTPVQSATYAKDLVAGQFPDAGTSVSLGSTVEITLSLGRTGLLIPILTGLKQADAEAARAALGLVGQTFRYIDGIGSGFVLNQSVAPGTPANVGDAVDIVVSSNLLPNVLGEIIQDAMAILQAANLTVSDTVIMAYDRSYPAYTISNQSPLPDTVVAPGALVTLTMSLGPPPAIPGATPRHKRIANTYQ